MVFSVGTLSQKTGKNEMKLRRRTKRIDCDKP